MINPFRSNQQYKNIATLRGPQDAVTTLTFSAQAKFLAATGLGGVNVWNINNHQVIPFASSKVGVPHPNKIVFPVAIWVYFMQRSQHVLLLGTCDSTIQLWDYVEERATFELKRTSTRHEKSTQVVSIDSFQTEVASGGQAKIAVSFFDRTVSVLTFTINRGLKKKFSVPFEESFMLKTVRFEVGSGNIFVFAMNGGSVALLEGKTGNTIWRKMDAPSPYVSSWPLILDLLLHFLYRGSISVDRRCKQFVACTSQGFELFDLERVSPIKQFESEPIRLSFPKCTIFTEDDTKVVGSTDCGCAEVYDLKTGKMVQTLEYKYEGLVQAVSACQTAEHFLAAIAGSNGHQVSDVLLWQKPRPQSSFSPKPDNILFRVNFPIKKSWFMQAGYRILFFGILFGYSSLVAFYSDSMPSQSFLLQF
ncbi:WD40 repeat-like protein [Gymnopus androsaceus JB14]|uniref:WD repeat-containing protein JIP5 n=1 Tax=Gymnopus androsaceus JB14 TaxID=1447944 RepID=A0A6A4GLV5_9AGAR|nr:WD40 repeat-like protein [Gymnopus androsaceus JB14]